MGEPRGVKVIETERRMLGAQGLRVSVEWGQSFGLQDEERSGEGWWWRLHNSVNVLTAPELCT